MSSAGGPAGRRLEFVLFDLDGVLADSRLAITSCMNAALEATGHPPWPAEDLRRFIGPSLSYGFGEILGVDDHDPAIEACVLAYREHYAEASIRDTAAYPGVVEAVAALAERVRLGVATSKPRAFAEPLLEALGLAGFFEVVAAPDLAIHVESKTATVTAALASLGATGPGAMVGDRDVDMIAAHEHGLRAVGALWGFGTETELRAAGADVLAPAPSDLPNLKGLSL